MNKIFLPFYIIRRLGFKRMRQALAIGLTIAWSFVVYRVLRWKAEREGSRSSIPARLPFKKKDTGSEE